MKLRSNRLIEFEKATSSSGLSGGRKRKHEQGSRYEDEGDQKGKVIKKREFEFDGMVLRSGRTKIGHSMKVSSQEVDESNENDGYDDSCILCDDGGNLVCCDGCPSTFHLQCLNIQNMPSGKWYCGFCRCKFCKKFMKRRGALIFEMYSCSLCEDKFHKSCLREASVEDIDSDCRSFCGRNCRQIYEKLHTSFWVKTKLPKGLSFTLVRRFDLKQDSKANTRLRMECNSKLDVAYSVMSQCFDPIVDRISGVEMIKNVVYNVGSNFKRLNYTGFFTAILERGDEMISVASIRIHGNELAEMPFVGTRTMYRNQGMSRYLVDSIESVLRSLGVGKLVIPAIPYISKMWINKFGFKPLEETTRQTMRSMSMVVFPGTIMLQKDIPEKPVR